MEKLFEKILPRISLKLAFVAFVVSVAVAIVNPIGVFQLIFEFIFQIYSKQNLFFFFFLYFPFILCYF